ncbi:MAG TPA: outer membrane beta-barrel protein [Burkholderiales bacterium]|nr:outer membrane beta-barrel protein [Burkholderiales bacterium]
MKRLVTTVAAAALLPWLAAPAWAQDAGFYVGGALGQVEHQDACEGASISCDEKDTGWKVFAGYQFNRYIAAELGYADLGESSASGVVGPITARANFEVTAWELVAVGSYPVMERLSLFGKLGLYRAETELTGSGTVGTLVIPVSEKESNADVTFGFGVRFNITRNLGVRAEWQRYLDVGGDDVGESDVDFISLGVVFRF